MNHPYPTDLPTAEPLCAELLRLLGELTFSRSRGAYAEGEHVCVAVNPHRNDDGTYAALVSCLARGNATVDWRRVAVWLEYEQEGGPQSTAPRGLDRRGQAWLPGVPPVRCGLRAGSWQVVPLPPRQFTHEWSGAAVPALAAQSAGLESLEAESAESGSDEPRIFPSADGKVTATVRPVAEGLELAFETAEPALQNAAVHFALSCHETGEKVSGEVLLQRAADPQGPWEGIWPRKIEFAGPFDLLFYCQPPRPRA